MLTFATFELVSLLCIATVTFLILKCYPSPKLNPRNKRRDFPVLSQPTLSDLTIQSWFEVVEQKDRVRLRRLFTEKFNIDTPNPNTLRGYTFVFITSRQPKTTYMSNTKSGLQPIIPADRWEEAKDGMMRETLELMRVSVWRELAEVMAEIVRESGGRVHAVIASNSRFAKARKAINHQPVNIVCLTPFAGNYEKLMEEYYGDVMGVRDLIVRIQRG